MKYKCNRHAKCDISQVLTASARRRSRTDEHFGDGNHYKGSSMTQSAPCNCITFAEWNNEWHYCKTPHRIRLGGTSAEALLLAMKNQQFMYRPRRAVVSPSILSEDCRGVCSSFWSPSCLHRHRQQREAEDPYATRHDNGKKRTWKRQWQEWEHWRL